jgi:hypothetical protein
VIHRACAVPEAAPRPAQARKTVVIDRSHENEHLHYGGRPVGQGSPGPHRYPGRHRTGSDGELVGHLAALELRPSLYLAQGYGSLFEYCTQALHLSEDAACNRTKVVRTCQQFPVVLDLFASGRLTLTAVRLLGPHLTLENHEAVLARAARKARGDIEALIAELAPRPDVPASVRKLPEPRGEAGLFNSDETCSRLRRSDSPGLTIAQPSSGDEHGLRDVKAPSPAVSSTPRPAPRPIVQALAPERYRVQFTISQETHDRLRRVQALLRREIPNGDPALIFDQALELLEETAKSRLGFTARPRSRTSRRATAGPTITAKRTLAMERGLTGEPHPHTAEGRKMPNPDEAGRAYETRIRFETDKRSRHIPNAVKRAVWRRDQGRCAFTASTGRRCGERSFLEFHHVRPYAMEGPASVGNISLRCRRHNAYEAEMIFGPRDPSIVRESSEVYRAGARCRERRLCPG